MIRSASALHQDKPHADSVSSSEQLAFDFNCGEGCIGTKLIDVLFDHKKCARHYRLIYLYLDGCKLNN